MYVRIDSQTRYQPCRIVDVVPELDVAVLKIENNPGDKVQTYDEWLDSDPYPDPTTNQADNIRCELHPLPSDQRQAQRQGLLGGLLGGHVGGQVDHLGDRRHGLCL